MFAPFLFNAGLPWLLRVCERSEVLDEASGLVAMREGMEAALAAAVAGALASGADAVEEEYDDAS